MNPVLQDKYIAQCKAWLQNFVIELGLCPFAKKPFINERIRYVVIEEEDPEQRLLAFWDEVQLLKQEQFKIISTSLLILPRYLEDFEDYLDFYDLAEILLEDQNEFDNFQLASLHPNYQFGDTETDDVSNYTNRAPFPIIHILRTDEVADVIDNYPDMEEIPKRNIRLMREMGEKALLKILRFEEDEN